MPLSRLTLTDSRAVASPPFTKTGLEYCGWGAWDGLYRYNRQNGTFTRYTESQALASSVIQGILEDKAGRLRLSTKKGIPRFDPQTETFRNYFDGPRKLPVQTVFLTRCPRSVADCEQRQLDKRTA